MSATCKMRPSTMLTCTICLKKFGTLAEHFDHHNLIHKLSLKSLLSCGVINCVAKVPNLDRYKLHFSKFHANIVDQPSSSFDLSEHNDSGNNLMYKCAQTGCNYKSTSISSLRGHRFWSHRIGGGSCESEGLSHLQRINADASIDDPSDILVNLPEQAQTSKNQPDLPDSSEEDCSDPTLSLKKRFYNLGLNLTWKHHVADTTVGFIIDSYSTIISEAMKISTGTLKTELLGHGIQECAVNEILKKVSSEDVMSHLHSAQGPMRSAYMRSKQYAEHFPCVPPSKIHLGLNGFNAQCKFHYIPIKDSLKSFLEEESVYEQFRCGMHQKSVLATDDYLTDLHSGSAFTCNKLFSVNPDALQLIIYHDDFDVVNCVGPSAGKFKMTHLSYTLGNLFPWNRSKVDPLQLLMLCKETDVSYFGHDAVFKRLISDLKDLEVNGIQIRGELVKATVLVILGDNKGTHSLAGITEGFSNSKYFCRYCEESRDAWLSRWYGTESGIRNTVEVESASDDDSEDDSEDSDEDANEDGNDSEFDVPLAELVPLSKLAGPKRNKAPLRTTQSYDECTRRMHENPSGCKGVVGTCPFNELKYFHVIGGTPPCLPHDVLEGILPYDLMMAIKTLGRTYKFSLEYLNRKISSFPFKGSDSLDKPSARFNARHDKVKGNAVQNHVLLRFLPLFIGAKITNKSDPVWIMILKLIEIMKLICSPVICRKSLDHVDSQILEYLKLRTTLFKVRLRPKHHFFEHYKMLILMYGPLMRSSTLRFESKHRYFREELRSKKCLKNPTYSLSKAHQQMQGGLRMNHLFSNRPSVEDGVAFDEITDKPMYDFICETFGPEMASKMIYSDRITYHNTSYAANQVVVTSTVEHPKISVCDIKLLASDGKNAFAIGIQRSGLLNFGMQVYCLNEGDTHCIVNLNDLKDYVSYYEYSSSEFPSVIVLKHLVLEM